MAFDAFNHYTANADIKDQKPDPATCLSQNARFDRTVEYYADSVTSFYQTYSVDDDVPIRVLIEEFSTHETPAEFHNSLRPRQP
jgi:hypothetical protein